MKIAFAICLLARVALACLISALVAPYASAGGDILLDARRAALGESTVPRNPTIPSAVEKGSWPDFDKAVAANDQLGLKQLFDAGKLVAIADTQELLIIEIDMAAVLSLRRDMLDVADRALNVERDCLRDKITCVKRGLPVSSCEKIYTCQKVTYDDEYTKAYSRLQPNVSPEDFWDKVVFVRVRILGGDTGGLAVWTKLKYLKLPSHPKIQDPGQ